MKPSLSKKKGKKKKKSSLPAAAPAPPPAEGAADTEACPPLPGTITLTAATAAAAVVSETESSSSGEASTCPSACFTASSSGTASSHSFSALSSSASTASSSAAGEERRDLTWLLDAFASATFDQIDSAYREAGGDPFVAAGILSSTQDTHPPQPPQPAPQPPPPPDLSPRSGSGGRKAGRRPKRVAVAATGMVADVIGKEYTRPAANSVVSMPNAWKGRDGESDGSGSGGRKDSVEEAEQFLCSMLGDNSELGMGVVRDVLGQYGYDVEKALDALLDISGVSSVENMETNHQSARRNDTCHLDMFSGNGLSVENLTAGNRRSLRQLTDEISNTGLQSELGHEFLWGEPQISDYEGCQIEVQVSSEPIPPIRYAEAVKEAPRSSTLPSRSTVMKAGPQQVLDSLFKIPETRTYEPSSMDWKKVVKKLQTINYTAASNNHERPKDGGGYRELRGVAARHYDKMKEYYQKAAFAYSKGDRSYASYLAEEGKHYRELGRIEDEKASRNIFEARNKHITNTVTIDLHGQHVQHAMNLLKIHMMICICIPCYRACGEGTY
ncbi:SMR domain-containing protein At5g58720 isoform X2 [Zea mays]|uniref:SMR domain-containing protein At5g58720 isoform X2 n=1 Tax=Zea mays TaxID=4577 RepID=UPI0004DEB9E9|nr:uncharacterized protein LOC100278712 isoform X2 [Zea mays]|eukprot:XP_008672669.1 uncharacterized LOC100278712 isoform X3 [Zea mays]